MQEKETFGKYILTKRKEKHFTQRQLADQLFVSESAVSKWERGISYPDISLVSTLCQVLEISEHELITCSEDMQKKETERQAQYFRGIMKTYSLFFYICYGISLLICLIVNLVLEKRLSWFFIVLAGETVAFSITSLPQLVKGENKRWILFGTFYVAIQFLLLTSCLYSGGNWFGVTFVCITFGFMTISLPFLLRDLTLPNRYYQHKTLIYFTVETFLLIMMIAAIMRYVEMIHQFIPIGLPVTLLCVFPVWVLMLIIRYLRINRLLKTALCLFVVGIFEYSINSLLKVNINGELFGFAPMNLLNWNESYIDGNIKGIILIVLFILAIAFVIGGICLEVKNKD